MSVQKKVVLFGRTGDGKSTVANALLTGGIEREVFKTSSGMRGCTSEIKTASENRWTVTDTVGLGEEDNRTVSHTEAREMLTEFLQKVKSEYAHIIFVQKANRLDLMDKLNSYIFKTIFEGAERAFIILFTGADGKWLEENKEKLPAYMKGMKILVVNVPPIHEMPVTERRLKKIREKSILKLQADLVKIFEERQNKYSVPAIAGMNDEQLQEKSATLIRFIIDCIKKTFNKKLWLRVAKGISTLINLANLIIDVMALG